MKYDDLIYDRHDLAKAYSEKRKGVSKEEVADLLRVIILYLKKEMKEEIEYSFNIPKIGKLHRKIQVEQEGKNVYTKNDRLIAMIFESFINPQSKLKHKEITKALYGDFTKEEIQYFQNNYLQGDNFPISKK